MKHLILFSTMISSLALGQFTVSYSSDNWAKIGNDKALVYLYQKNDKSKAKIEYRDTNTMSMHNLDFSYYVFEFSTEPDTLDKIKGIIKENLESKKEGSITLEFPEGPMVLNFTKIMGRHYAEFQFEKANNLIDKGDRSMRRAGGITLKNIDTYFGTKK